MGDLAAEFGTPLYVYDAGLIADRYRTLAEAFGGLDLLLAYSVKANGNLAILDRVNRLGAGADIVSAGELFRARAAGIPAEKIVFAGVGKTETEIRKGVEARIHSFHVESGSELRMLDRVASEMGCAVDFGLRVNPDILSPAHHAYTRTGHAETKFGIPVDEVVALYHWARERPYLRARGIDAHIGSGIVEPEPYGRVLDTLLGLVGELRTERIDLEYVDLGGGFAVPQPAEPTGSSAPADPGISGMPVEALADLVCDRIRQAGLGLVLEPGRFLVAEAGTLLTTVLHVKRNGSKIFVVTDGGMTELIRPSLYAGFHAVEAVTPRASEEAVVDVVGPICETGDFLALNRRMPLPEPGDVLAVLTAGAYGSAMASNYNSRRRPAEVLVEDGVAHLVRRRETFEDLVRGESIPAPASAANGGDPSTSTERDS